MEWMFKPISKNVIDEVGKNPRIQVFKGTTIEKVEGFVGSFKTEIKTKGERKTLDHGVIIVTTGGEEYRPTEFLYGQDPRITTQMDLEKEMVLHPESFKSPKNVVMIQCVGSRNDERPYCSRICCSEAVKNALTLKADSVRRPMSMSSIGTSGPMVSKRTTTRRPGTRASSSSVMTRIRNPVLKRWKTVFRSLSTNLSFMMTSSSGPIFWS